MKKLKSAYKNNNVYLNMINFENLPYKERVRLLKEMQTQHKKLREAERSKGLTRCPYCNYNKIQRNGRRKNGTQMYFCPKCRKSFSESSRTCFHNVKQKDKMRKCLQLMSVGYLSVKEMAEALDVSTMTAFNWRHKILTALIPKSGDKNVISVEVPLYQKGKRDLKVNNQKCKRQIVNIVKPGDKVNTTSIENEFREWMQTQMKGVSGKYLQHYAAWFSLISESVTPVEVDEILERVMTV